MSSIFKLAEGNQTALHALLTISPAAPLVAPDSLSGSGFLIQLDALGIFGADIAALWTFCCHGSPIRFLAVLRAVQLGLHQDEELYSSIRAGTSINWVSEVQTKLPNFARPGCLTPAFVSTTAK